jgi:lipopolysaccharide biosynthesis protein
MSAAQVRLLAFYLPQFHPIPENDEWWGKGFTEWANVAKAQPLFPGHYQPHLPADLGFYDLRLPETRQAQADLAREYGISGFVYYHFWFGGKRLLERPFDEVLVSRQPDFPFCLCWANENWTRVWDGDVKHVLMEQQYSEADDLAHIRWFATAFQDKRYIRFEGKPLLLVYRAGRLPDPLRTTTIWREQARKMGLGELFLCRIENFTEDRGDPRDYGFDASVEFQPDALNYGPRLKNSVYGDQNVYNYEILVERQLRKPEPPYRRFSCVTPGWDNSARRRSQATILMGSTPALYEFWLRTVIQKARQCENAENLVFINAWNEWGEGNHLEPDLVFGRRYLEATRCALLTEERSDFESVRFGHSDENHRVYITRLEEEEQRLQKEYLKLERWAHELEEIAQKQDKVLQRYQRLTTPFSEPLHAWRGLKRRLSGRTRPHHSSPEA